MPKTGRAPKTASGKTTVQSLIFPKSKYTKVQAVAWAKTHKYHSSPVEETGSSYRIRQYDPEHFKSFRTMAMPNSGGVKAVIGVVKMDEVDKDTSAGGHNTPPKGYPKDKSSYANPSRYKYPIDTEAHVRAAISYFSKPKNSGVYSPAERAAIWSRIKAAAKKFGIKMEEKK